MVLGDEKCQLFRLGKHFLLDICSGVCYKALMTSFPTETTLSLSRQEHGDETFVTRTKQRGISEREFSKWFGKNWLGFGFRIEPGLGGDVGAPDWMILPDCLPATVGVELKLGKVTGGTLYLEEVRPAQVSLHSRLAMAGGVSVLLVWSTDGIFVIDASFINQWEDGYSISGGEADGAYALNDKDPESFSQGLDSFIEDLITE